MSRKSRMQAQGEEDSEHPWFSGSNVFFLSYRKKTEMLYPTAMNVTV